MSEPLQDHIHGDWQHPVNLWQGLPNSIHTDEVAAKIGMRGGTIPGSVHLGHFAPVLTQLFGDAWTRSATISMYYTYATTDREAVRAVVKAPPPGAIDAMMEAWIEDADGKIVAKGTLSVGRPVGIPYLRGMPLEPAAPGSLRILSRMSVGMAYPAEDGITLKGDGVVRDPTEMFRALRVVAPDKLNQPAVGFYGGSEITIHNGPLRAGVTYRKTGEVICLGETGKTEFAWIDSALHDQDGVLVASMRHLNRWMKASSPLWKAA